MHANSDEIRGYEVLPDGTEIVIRPLHPEDRGLITEGFSLLGPDSRYQRYFTHKQSLGDDELRFLDEPQGLLQRAVGMAAWNDEGHERPIGVARYVRLAPGSDAAEAAITIVDTMHGKGLGKLLMRKLCEAAHRDGIRTFRARVLTDNLAAIRLMRWVDPGMRVLAYEQGAEELEIRLPAPAQGLLDCNLRQDA